MIISLCKVITLNNDCFIIKKLGSVTLGVYVMQSPVVEIIYNVSPINTDNIFLRDYLIVPLISLLIYFALALIQITSVH